ncbi:MAG: hypothetical protein K0R61_5470 [Microvirga sp.]|nr:hypothetical protein [Microvirga sp.]
MAGVLVTRTDGQVEHAAEVIAGIYKITIRKPQVLRRVGRVGQLTSGTPASSASGRLEEMRNGLCLRAKLLSNLNELRDGLLKVNDAREIGFRAIEVLDNAISYRV